MQKFLRALNNKAKISFLGVFLILFTENAFSQLGDEPPLVQPKPYWFTMSLPGATYVGSYISEDAALAGCKRFLPDSMEDQCIPAIYSDTSMYVAAYRNYSTLFQRWFWGPGTLNCDNVPSWVTECYSPYWVIIPTGVCDEGYVPDEFGKCTLECDNGMIRDGITGACNVTPPPEEEVEFPNILDGALDGIAIYECLTDSGLNALTGNPINVLTGNKVQHEVDYVIPGAKPFEVSRTYNSNTGRWYFSVERTGALSTITDESGLIIDAELIDFDGRKVNFTREGEKLIPTNLDSNVGYLEVQNVAGSSDSIVNYKPDGTNYVYSLNGGLRRVEYKKSGFWDIQEAPYGLHFQDNLGNQFEVHVSETGLLTSIRHNDVAVVLYTYNSARMLTKVTYQNEKFIEYLYQDLNRPYLLTGKIGKAGSQIAGWSYNELGYAVESYQMDSSGAKTNIHRLEYALVGGGQSGSITETNPLGKKTTYQYETISGLRRITGVEGHPTDYCLAREKNYTYYPNGLLSSTIGWDGIKNVYEYDELGRKTLETRALGTAIEHTVTFIWHEKYNVLKSINSPNRTIDFTYDSEGNMTGKTIRSRQ